MYACLNIRLAIQTSCYYYGDKYFYLFHVTNKLSDDISYSIVIINTGVKKKIDMRHYDKMINLFVLVDCPIFVLL